jgi:hypothetical protein
MAHGINANIVDGWRKLYASGEPVLMTWCVAQAGG